MLVYPQRNEKWEVDVVDVGGLVFRRMGCFICLRLQTPDFVSSLEELVSVSMRKGSKSDVTGKHNGRHPELSSQCGAVRVARVALGIH